MSDRVKVGVLGCGMVSDYYIVPALRFGVLDIAANAVVNLNGTYVNGATTLRSNATLNWSSAT